MRVTRPALAALGALLALALVPLSAAVVTTSTASDGRVSSAVDWTPPSVAVAAGPAVVRGTVTLTATATDADSSLQSVRLEVRAADSTGAWTTLCTDTTSPYSCDWATPAVPDGAYDVRAVATDVHGNTATSATVRRSVDNLGPVVAIDEAALPDYLTGTVTVTAAASDAGGITSVTLQRGDGQRWTDLCVDTSAPYSCAWNTVTGPNDALRALATDVSGNTTTSATVFVSVDNTAPAVQVTPVGSPVAGVVTVGATASDADSGVASVRLELRAAAATTWTPLCTDPTSPYSCRWDTTGLANGSYVLRGVATDNAGLTTTSATVTTNVDNTVAAVSLDDPGAFLRGTVSLVANASAPSGVRQVVVQYAPTGTATWTTVCTATTAPYTCAWDTTKVAGGLYDLRAVLTPVSGAVVTSATVARRTVDNAPLRGVDVQAANGGTAGRVDAGDSLVLTYDSVVSPGSVLAGWDGSARAVGLRLRDGSAAGGVGGEDVVDVLGSPVGTAAPVNLGSVNTRGNWVKGQAMVFNATMTATTVTVNGAPATRITVVLGTLTNADNGRNFRSSRTMAWTPSTAARDLAGNPASAAPVEELGALDRDF